ncbi:hypothetical protein BASA83_000142 [Batrachochytrium salamandrivorans]|nr:hypothetical protein BASA83_000142 [Batrachochytrium salamandrivorans]
MHVPTNGDTIWKMPQNDQKRHSARGGQDATYVRVESFGSSEFCRKLHRRYSPSSINRRRTDLSRPSYPSGIHIIPQNNPFQNGPDLLQTKNVSCLSRPASASTTPLCAVSPSSMGRQSRTSMDCLSSDLCNDMDDPYVSWQHNPVRTTQSAHEPLNDALHEDGFNGGFEDSFEDDFENDLVLGAHGLLLPFPLPTRPVKPFLSGYASTIFPNTEICSVIETRTENNWSCQKPPTIAPAPVVLTPQSIPLDIPVLVYQGVMDSISSRNLTDKATIHRQAESPHRLIFSECFDLVFHSGVNVVISAPTGSGKTVLMELAILRLLTDTASDQSKVVYIAPTKALCSERARDWKHKFSSLGFTCQELTGDTEFNNTSEIQRSNLIVTTPEKWDTVTRKWRDHRYLMNMLRLVLLDEVHILKEHSRGATLEVIVSRMKAANREICVNSTPDGDHQIWKTGAPSLRNHPKPANIRILAISATVPNIQDIAEWLKDGSGVPAQLRY